MIICPLDSPWITKEIKVQIKKRNKAHKLAKRTNNPNDWENFRKIRNSTIEKVRKGKQDYYTHIDNKINNYDFDDKQWWKIIKSFTKRPCNNKRIFPAMFEGDNCLTDPEHIANAFNTYFVKQSILVNDDKQLPLLEQNTNSINCINLNVTEVKDNLLCLNISKASGPDAISNYILKLVQIACPVLYVNCTISWFLQCVSLLVGKSLMSFQFTKIIVFMNFLITDLYHY